MLLKPITSRFHGSFALTFVFALLLSGLQLSLAVEVKLAEDPDLSPDGERIVFAWQNDLWLVSSNGGRARRLTFGDSNESHPKFSPDGKQVAFVSNRTGSNQVFLIPVVGGEPQQLTFHTGGFELQQWLDDGQHLLVSASRDHFWREPQRLYRLSIEPNSKPELLFDGYAGWGRISPDGKTLAFTREGTQWWRKEYRGSQSSQIWLYDLQEQTFSALVKEETAGREPLWMPDNKNLLYVSNRSGDFQLWRQGIESSEPAQLTQFDDDSIVMPTISDNGQVVVFRHLFDLYRFEPESGERPKRLKISVRTDEVPDPQIREWVSEASEAAFTKDGLEIAMIAGGDLWVMDTELREPKRITATAELESNPLFSADGETIYFVSEQEGQCDIWSAKRADAEKYWWLNDEFERTRLTNDSDVEYGLKLSPDGKSLAYLKSRGDLWLRDLESGNERRILESWDEPSFDFSSDSQWLTYSVSDNDFNRDVWILSLEEGAQPVNVSRHPDNEGEPVWSPDGRIIAFTGRRVDTEVDIYFVYVTDEDDETTQRDRKLKEALEKIQKQRKKPVGKSTEPNTEPMANGDAAKPDEESKEKADEESEAKDDKEESKRLELDLNDIHLRLRQVSIPDTREGSLFWSPDSKKLAFQATIDGRRGVYTIEPDGDLSPSLLTPTTGSNPVWLKAGNQIVWLVGGTPSALNASNKQSSSYGFRARHDYDRRDKFQAGFVMAWRAMRDNFYDGNLNNRNWDEIRRKYEPMARESLDVSMLGTVVNLMLGELNGSHLGFFAGGRGRGAGGGSASNDWQEETAHFGLRFDESFKGPGLKVRDVIYDSPADQNRSRIEPGEIVLAINGTEVDPGMNLPDVLNGPLDQEYVLKVQPVEGEPRDVTIRPISFGAARSLLYEHWVRSNQKWVEEASGGKLGYMHIRGMNMPSFYRFEQELYAVGAGKEGLVIDVRENGGGSTTDHLLTALTQPVHAITRPRGGGEGYPHDRKVYASWNKPIIVLCNQNSFSNAEIFSHAIKTLGRGQVVGVPTAGGVISTGGTSIMDLGFLRMPFRGWYLINDGEDMELNGAVPHHILWPEPTQMPAGKDIQLEKATELLMDDVEEWLSRDRPELIKASERPGRPRQ